MHRLPQRPTGTATDLRAARTERLGLAELAAIGPHDHERRLSAIVRIAATVRAEDALRLAARRRADAIAAAEMAGASAT